MSPETLDLIQKGGVVVLLLIAVAWLVADRNRLLKSLADKDDVISAKDDKLIALSREIITAVAEFRGTLQSVVDIINKRAR